MMTKPLAATLLLVLLLTAGCGGVGGSGSESASDSGGSTSTSLVGPATSSSAKGADSSARTTKQTRTPLTRSVISTGRISLHARSLDRTRAEVQRLVSSWGGAVGDERTTSDARGRAVDSTLTLRVPSARFSEAMTDLAGLGTVEEQSRTSRDVSTQVVDNDARVRAAERSIRQIEALLDRATKLSDVIAIESDLAQRQADLDSLRSQQAYLDDQTSLSTINVFLSRTTTAAPRHETRGFLSGLGQGWDAFGAMTVSLTTGLGAALPFAVLLGLLGVPLLWVVRRRRSVVPPVKA